MSITIISYYHDSEWAQQNWYWYHQRSFASDGRPTWMLTSCYTPDTFISEHPWRWGQMKIIQWFYFSKFRQGRNCTPAIPANLMLFFGRCAQVPRVPVTEVEYINNCSHLPSATGIEIAAGPKPAQITQVSSWDLLFRCGIIWTVGSACSCHCHKFYMPPSISWFLIL